MEMDRVLMTYGFLGVIGLIGIACTYWSQHRHRKRHQHHGS